MIEPTVKTIGNYEITVQPWGAVKAWKNQLLFGRIFENSLEDLGAALNDLIGAAEPPPPPAPMQPGADGEERITTEAPGDSYDDETVSLTEKIDLGRLGSAIAKLIGNLSENQAEDFLKKCLQGVLVDGKELKWAEVDLAFRGRVLDLYKIIGLVLEVNYGSFLGKGGIGGLLKKSPIQ